MAKVMISLPDPLLEQIDAEAQRRNMSRSEWLRRVAEREIPQPLDREAMEAAIKRSRERFKRLGSFDSAEVIRQERDRMDRRDARRAR